MKECTIEMKIAVTKVIETPDEPVKAKIAADKAIKGILGKLDSCDQVQVIEAKQFHDFEGEK